MNLPTSPLHIPVEVHQHPQSQAQPRLPDGHVEFTDQDELAGMAGQIQTEFDRAKSAAEKAVDHAIRCGQLLVIAKTKVPHGSWMKWVENNTTMSRSTVNAFMLLAANYQTSGNLKSIKSALSAIADKHRQLRREIAEDDAPPGGKPTEAEHEADPPNPPPQPPPSGKSGAVILNAEVVAPASAPPTSEVEHEEVVVHQTKRAKSSRKPTVFKLLPSDVEYSESELSKNAKDYITYLIKKKRLTHEQILAVAKHINRKYPLRPRPARENGKTRARCIQAEFAGIHPPATRSQREISKLDRIFQEIETNYNNRREATT
ncbi:MAG: DUF3102 domain-containing protein [Akkermansiaceae bacterium]|nr:DUF3102 domain-containing protein [Akkermansiaceae bacterium]